jgi:hypothetical protein
MRINGFHQISAFYSIVFSQKYDFKPQHISLYMFLLNQNNRNNWVEWFKCPIDLGMTGSCIGSKKTYYQCLDDLQAWGLLVYQKGENMWKAPKIKIEVLKYTATDTSTIPQSEPLPIPHANHNLHPYINLQPTTDNIKTKKVKQESKPEEKIHPLQAWIKQNCPRVSKLKKQLTFEEAERITTEFERDQIKAKLLAMENKAKLDYVSVNLTLRNWLIKDQLNPAIQGFSNYQTEPAKNPRSRP